MADWYTEDATYGWMYTPDEHFMAVGREQIREWALGQEMAGLDGWHYDYAVHRMVDESNGMVVGFWKQKSGITDDATGKEYEILGIGGSWFGVDAADGASSSPGSATGSTSAVDRDDVPRDRRLRQGTAGAARPDARRRHGASPVTTGYADLPSTRLAAAGRARGLRHQESAP